MTFQLVILTAICAFTANMAANLRAIRIPVEEVPALQGTPFVSILVPARNEEANIADCINSLRMQDYPDFEVLVLDDESTDRTAEIVAAIASEDLRVRLLHGAPLPCGWAGKPHACHQLSLSAKGDYLLFTDADTTHAPEMLSTVLALAQGTDASILSGFPHQIVRTLPEKIVIPVLYFLLISVLPLSVTRHCGYRWRTFMNGQFLLFPRSEYDRIGGHESAKSRIMEDIALGIEIRKKDGRQVVFNLSPVVSCRMYRDQTSLWQGFVKWGYSFWALWPVGTLIGGLVLLVGFSSPFFSVAAALFLVQEHGMRLLLIVFIQVAVVLLARLTCDRALNEPAVSAWLTPLGVAFFLLAMLYGVLLRGTRRQVQWKQRTYGGSTAVA